MLLTLGSVCLVEEWIADSFMQFGPPKGSSQPLSGCRLKLTATLDTSFSQAKPPVGAYVRVDRFVETS